MKSRFRRKHFSRAWVLDLGYDTIEKCFENPDFIFCSTFQNLRLGSIILTDTSSMMRSVSMHVSRTTSAL